MTLFDQKTVTLPDGTRTRYFDQGDGPILLLLHGNPDNADEWKNLIGLMSGRFRCIAPDLPGYGRHGATQPLVNSFDYSRQAQIGFVDAFLEAADIRGTLTLVVHDIGGIMGVPWAAQQPERLDAMVYCNTVAYPRFEWFELAYRWGNDSPAGRHSAQRSMAAIGWFGGFLFRRIFRQQHPRLSKADLDRFVTDFALNPEAKETTLREFRQLTKPEFFDGYDAMLATINGAVPTVTVWGEGDPYVPDHFATQLGAAKTVVLPGVGHWVPIIGAEALAEQILAVRGMS